MDTERRRKVEFGDFQTPDALAQEVCEQLTAMGVRPNVVVEPTCGVGAFVIGAARAFPQARSILGFEVNAEYLSTLRERVATVAHPERIQLEQADFFAADWRSLLPAVDQSLLVLGNFPWVTNAAQGAIDGGNLPEKSNFQGRSGFDAITGKANFDISEWMLLEVLRWFEQRSGTVAMLVKTGVARKVLAQAERQRARMAGACLYTIDAKRHFGASVEACLLVMHFTSEPERIRYDYEVFDSLHAPTGRRIGHRAGQTVSNLDDFERFGHLLGASPQKWRSGVKHDASAVMEFRPTERGLENGLGEVVDLEPTFCFPLMKGSDVGNGRAWDGKRVLVTQRAVGQPTDNIRTVAPKTWAYLNRHADALARRGSTIYAKSPPFSVFGVGDYAFRPWRLAICGLYKALRFNLVGPIEGQPVMFDDTVYYVSFDTEAEARRVLDILDSEAARGLLSSLIFWDDKRPIKASVLNVLDWS